MKFAFISSASGCSPTVFHAKISLLFDDICCPKHDRDSSKTKALGIASTDSQGLSCFCEIPVFANKPLFAKVRQSEGMIQMAE